MFSAQRNIAVGVALCAAVGATVGLVAFGAAHWRRAARRLLRRLDATRRPASARRYDARELEGLPAPVQRYFRAALTDGQPLIAAVSIELAGRINLSATGERWKPFTSTQRVVTRGPGFVWDAEVRLLPGVAVHVADGYIAGEGLLCAALLGLFPVAQVHGGGEIARGELIRYFAEMAWYPTALLPSQGVRWEAIDDRTANATFVDGPLASTLLFRFDDAGLIDSVRAEARGAMVGKEMQMIPWEGRWSDYQRRDGMMLPMKGEAAWLRPEGRWPYFLGAVTSLRVEFQEIARLPIPSEPP